MKLKQDITQELGGKIQQQHNEFKKQIESITSQTKAISVRVDNLRTELRGKLEEDTNECKREISEKMNTLRIEVNSSVEETVKQVTQTR